MAIHVVFTYDVGISNDNVSGVNWYLLRMCGPILSAKILLGRGPLQKTLQETFREYPDSEPDQRRYPLRNRNTRKHFDDYSRSSVADLCLKVSDVVPVTYSQAVKSEDSQLWQKAMDSEMESLKDNNVFTVIPLPNGKKAVGGRWVYSLKNNPNGDVAHKARFVAKDYAQVKGSDYSDTFSPTTKMTTVRMLMQVSADHELVVHQLDVKTAYLNAPIDCEVYTIQPEGYKETKDGMNLVWKLNKSLYGPKQSGRNWNLVLSEFFQQNGFKQSEVDACLYFKHGESVIIFYCYLGRRYSDNCQFRKAAQ